MTDQVTRLGEKFREMTLVLQKTEEMLNDRQSE